PDDVTKPAVSLDALPPLVARAAPIAIVNALPVAGQSMAEVVRQLSRGYPHTLEVRHLEVDNRILVCTRRPRDVRAFGLALRGELRSIGSEMAHGLAIRRLG